MKEKRTISPLIVQSGLMIDRRLKVLRVVADRGTVSAAAEHLGYTASAVSHQMRTLSRDLGVALLEPDGRRVRLTPAAVARIPMGAPRRRWACR